MSVSDGTWCTYRWEWITWRYSLKQGTDGRRELKEWLGGLGLDGNPSVRISEAEGVRRWRVEIEVPVLKGEWVTRDLAEIHRDDLGGLTEVMRLGSAEEARLLADGKKLKETLRR